MIPAFFSTLRHDFNEYTTDDRIAWGSSPLRWNPKTGRTWLGSCECGCIFRRLETLTLTLLRSLLHSYHSTCLCYCTTEHSFQAFAASSQHRKTAKLHSF